MFAGGVAAFAIAAAALYAELLVLHAESLTLPKIAEYGLNVLAMLPFVAAVVVLGTPVALVVDRLCDRLELGPRGTLLGFAVLGVFSGLAMWGLFGQTVLFAVPAMLAPPFARVVAWPLARHRRLLVGTALVCIGLVATTVVMWVIALRSPS
ncbi:hypothetical protein GCM10010470_50170 [Saccharopolyspora taberi]|uniref:Permease n=2 Tax=Saccharopolyspora taberi TaxID=60895 RepID=A0ABN3VJD8_9PSEU